MKEIRIHGRGGQGSVVTAELFAIAAYMSGRQSQAFPYLGGGGERRGAPVQAFVRINSKPIQLHSKIYNPDYIIVQDTTLMSIIDVMAGIKPGGIVIINSELSSEEYAHSSDVTVKTVPATRIALETIGRPIMNTAMMGAFAAITKEFTIGAIISAIKEKFNDKVAEGNIEAAQMAYNYGLKIIGEEG
ncbi:MAG: pyruvate ferredoxin oxidoreductase subunit gamma [Dethiobacter sp.]|jgi:pyruvate ferredoxin oxidoreductase gamma subunit|nr:pyruvate ferredoxin oxidoreductase subunit gamma [Dethiobacter sp.]